MLLTLAQLQNELEKLGRKITKQSIFKWTVKKNCPVPFELIAGKKMFNLKKVIDWKNNKKNKKGN